MLKNDFSHGYRQSFTFQGLEPLNIATQLSKVRELGSGCNFIISAVLPVESLKNEEVGVSPMKLSWTRRRLVSVL